MNPLPPRLQPANTKEQTIKRILNSRAKWGFNILASSKDALEMFKEVNSVAPRDKKRLYGQVFTPVWVADYMASLCIKDGAEKGIEPCFGKGIFITTVAKRLIQLNKNNKRGIWKKITGIEIDPPVFLEGVSEYLKILGDKTPLKNLYLGSFFDFDNRFSKFDFGIMNPPYVRQEGLSSTLLPKRLQKEPLINKIKAYIPEVYINKRANLYVYFFFYLNNFIKEGGKIAAITYNSWLFSKFGAILQKFLLDYFKIKYVIDFDKEAFEDALIGSCIILMEKRTGQENKKDRDANTVQFVRLKSKAPLKELVIATESNTNNSKLVNKYRIRQSKLYSDSKWEKYFYMPKFHERVANNEKVIRLKTAAKVFRGVQAKSNRFFIVNRDTVNKFKINKKFILSFLKNPREVTDSKTSKSNFSTFLLHITKPKSILEKDNKAEGLLNYLSYIKDEIKKSSGKYRSLSREIENEKDTWHIQKLKGKGDIVFSYIIRGNKSFYVNDAKVITSDNFHNIKTRRNKYILFGILNSSLTKYLLELSGRTQGSGLLKVQVYELADLIIPNINIMSGQLRRNLTSLGQKLSKVSSKNNSKNKEIIKKIDDLIFKFLNLKDIQHRVISSEKHIMEDRLNRKRIKG